MWRQSAQPSKSSDVGQGSPAGYADAGFVGAVVGWVVTHAPSITLALQWGVSLAVIVSGGCAAWYHWKLARKLP